MVMAVACGATFGDDAGGWWAAGRREAKNVIEERSDQARLSALADEQIRVTVAPRSVAQNSEQDPNNPPTCVAFCRYRCRKRVRRIGG
jgi:hypothetical protein